MPEDTEKRKPEKKRLLAHYTCTTCRSTYTLANLSRHCRSKKHQDALDAWAKEEAMLQYFAKEVERYKQQDKKAKREVNESCYMTVKWLTDCLGKSCRWLRR